MTIPAPQPWPKISLKVPCENGQIDLGQLTTTELTKLATMVLALLAERSTDEDQLS
jgi:hypothetical protein